MPDPHAIADESADGFRPCMPTEALPPSPIDEAVTAWEPDMFTEAAPEFEPGGLDTELYFGG